MISLYAAEAPLEHGPALAATIVAANGRRLRNPAPCSPPQGARVQKGDEALAVEEERGSLATREISLALEDEEAATVLEDVEMEGADHDQAIPDPDDTEGTEPLRLPDDMDWSSVLSAASPSVLEEDKVVGPAALARVVDQTLANLP